MTEKKDFLDQFSSANKPESFQEEKRVPVQKKKFEPNWKWIGITSAAVAVVLGLVYFFFLAPKIEVPDFVGKPKTEIVTWVRQEGIESAGIVLRDEFSLEYDADVVISQTVAAGQKVGKNAKITFVVSKGADPTEVISLPDIKTMTRAEITEWIKSNKLAKTKINAVYSTSVEEGRVIDYELKSEDGGFTRGTVLNITVSKGPEPVKKVTVEDFSGKTLSDVASWAGKNKFKVKEESEFSSSVTAGNVTRTSPAKGESMESGGTITVYISKGKGIALPNFTAMSKTEFENWKRTNKTVAIDESQSRYSTRSGYILGQSPAAGSLIAEGESVLVTLNLGRTFRLGDESVTLVGTKIDQAEAKLNALREKGIDAYVGNWTSGAAIYSETARRGEIISVQCTGYSNNQRYACDGPLPLDARFDVVISKGLTWKLSPKEGAVDPEKLSISDLMAQLSAKQATFKLDPSVSAYDYDKEGNLYEGGTKLIVVGDSLYEDREYIIRK